MSTAQDLLNSYLSPAATSDVAPIPVASAAPNSTDPTQPAPNTAERLMNQIPTLALQKQADVAAKSTDKKVDIGGPVTAANVSQDQLYSAAIAGFTGQGLKTMPSEVEQDAATLPDIQLYMKYGDQAQSLISRRNAATNELQRDEISSRSGGEKLADSAVGVGLGIGNTIGGLASLGTGIFSNAGGTKVAQAVSDADQYIQSNLESPGLQAHQKVNAATNALGYRDDLAQQQLDKVTDGSFIAGLKRIGRDAGTAIGNATSDRDTLSDGIAQAAGSLVTGGPLGKAIGVGGKAVVGGLEHAGLLGVGLKGEQVAARLAQAYEGTGMTLSIGSMEAGGAYQQTAAQIMQQSDQDLRQNSPAYVDLVDNQKVSPEEARQIVAGRAGLLAASIQGPAAMLTGQLVSHFEAHPFSVPSLRVAGQNILKEGVEETLQSGTGQLAQNIATKTYADKNQDLLDGVGEQAGLGGLYGAASAGGVQLPGTIFSTGSKAALGAAKVFTAAGSGVAKAVGAAGAKAKAANEAASPVADETVAQAASEASQAAPAAAAQAQTAVQESDLPEKGKAAVSEYVQNLQNSIPFDPKEMAEVGYPQTHIDAVGDATNTPQALRNVSQYLSDEKNSPADRAAVLPYFDAFMAHFKDLVNEQPEELNKLPADHPARVFADDINSLYSSVTQTPSVQKAQEAREDLIKAAPNVTEDSTDAEIKHAVSVAEVAPERLPEGTAEAILKMASSGRVQISDSQKAALNTTRALLDGRKDYIDQLEKMGQSSPQDIVAKQISANQGSQEGHESALEHANAIRSAYNRGDFKGARAALNNFGKFTQSLQNKVSAVNDQIATFGRDANSGNSTYYNTISPDKTKWIRSAKTFGITPTSVNSVRMSQQVAAEAHALTGIHNALATAYPELKVQHIGQVALHSSLSNASPEQVSAEYKEGKRGQVEETSTESSEESNPEQASEEASVTKEESPVTATDSKPEDVPVEPKEQSVVSQEETTPAKETTSQEETKSVEEPKATPEPVKEMDSKDVQEKLVKDKTGLNHVFPDLVQPKSGNKFLEAFSLPEETRSQLAGVESPLDQVRQSLASPQDFSRDGKGASARLTDDVVKAYRRILGWVPHLVSDFNEHMQTFLDKTPKSGKQAGISNEDGLTSGKFEPNRYRNGKLLNLAELQEDGSYKLNQPLMETASIAGLQWFLSANQYGGVMDAKDAAEIFGVRQDNPHMDTLVSFLNQGISRLDAVSSLAQKIKSYWGVTTNLNAPAGYTDGIPQAMAAEILVSMKDRQVPWTDPETGEKHMVPMLVENQLRVDTKTGEILSADQKTTSKNIKTVSVLTPTYFDGIDQLHKFPDAIERVVSKTPDLNHYLDGERPPVAKTQMRNPTVSNTQEQQDMIANEQDTPFKVNQNMAVLYDTLDTEHLVNIFGPGEIDEDTMNINDANSKTGQRLAITSAFDVFRQTMESVTAHAQATGKDIDEVELRYGYNVSRVGRLQMLGRFNPQASKLMREVILPTQSTLDLTKGKNAKAFMLGLGQAIGVKVHNMQFGAMAAKTQGLLDGQFKPAIDQLRTFLENGKIDGDKLKDNLGDAPTFAMLHGLMEYARFLNADDKDLKSFKTQLYLEADGMTNGPVNAMALLSRGSFMPDWVKNMGRGGLWFGGTPDQNSTVQREKDPNDLYKATSDDLRERIRDMRQNLPANSPVKAQQTHLLNLMSLMLGKDVLFDGNDNVDLDRGIAKNPLTITIYGSGANGIAGNLVDQVVQKIYQQFSSALHAGNSITSLFGKDEEAKEKFKVFSQALTELRSNVVKSDGEGNFSIEPTGYTPESRDLKTFTFSPSELASLRQNMLSLFVEPMRQSIEKVVGPSLFESADMVRKATQIQSIMQQYAFQQAVQDRLAWKAKNDPNYVKGEFLSQKEQNDILKSLNHLAPLIKAPGQTFYVAGSQNAILDDNAGFAEAFDGTMETPATVFGPADAGVAGIPFLNIGMGDGKMMQNISTMPKAIPGTLKIFDGMNMPLDKIEEGSKQANQAVAQSWMGNPLKVVNDSYQSFLKDLSLKDVEPHSDQHAVLVRALFGLSETTKQHNLAKVQAAMNILGNSLQQGALEAEARHQTINRVNVSIDQMAAAASPYQVTNRTSITGSDEEVANQLNKIYSEELNKLGNQEPDDDELIGKELRSVGRAHSSGARVLSYTSIGQLASMLKLKIPAAQLTLLSSIQKSMAAKGYKTIIGTRDQLIAYNNSRGANALDSSLFMDKSNKGFMSPGRQEIYLMNPTSETLVHELIHASTFDTIQNYYDGENLGEHAEVISGAVQNIEKLMNQFLKMDGKVEGSPALQQAYADASVTIKNALGNTDLSSAQRKAQGLNEFMAWGLSNTDLNRQLSRSTAHPLVQLAKDAFAAIKALIWGRKKAPDMPGDDMLSNLQFNTRVILQGQPTMGKVMNDTTLFQSSSYGNSDRLQQLDNAFDRKVTDYVAVPDYLTKSQRLTEVAHAVNQGVQVTRMFSQAFPMTLQEKTTFSKIVGALATEAALDPNAASRMQQLWSQVTKSLTVDMLEDPKEKDPNQKRYDAQAKYDAVIGNNLTMVDGAGRSSLLPGFLALAMTNDQFRDVLSKMEIPKALKSSAESSVDRILENNANALMDSLSAKISGEGKSQNLRDAMDALSQRMTDIAQDRQSYMDQFLNTSGGLVDVGNQYLINAMDSLSKFLVNKAEAVDSKYNNRSTKLLAQSARLMAAVVNEDQAGKVSEGVMAAVNNVKGMKPFTDFINDLIGRTESNANVYDMIKTVRAMIAQDRQQFREIVPSTIAEQFSRTLTEGEWSLLHKAMGKTDLASLVQGMKQEDVLKVLSKPSELKVRIADLESKIQAEDAPNWNKYQNKMQQLAAYMMTGKTAINLLRNAEAISRLFNEHPKKMPTKSKDFVKNIDMLTSLYALEHMGLTERISLSEIATKEAKGMTFTLAYLQGQRAEEMTRANETDRALLNHFKGYVPTIQQAGSSLIIADDKNYAKLAARSYVRVGNYAGSTAEAGRSKKGYYYADVSGRNIFNQGILQNVRQTAGGVDQASGYSLDNPAGRITNAREVAKATYAIKTKSELAVEHLMPIYDENGNIVALERSVNPQQMARLQYNTNLSQMIGVWRGRQVEEAKSAIYNDHLVDNLHAMYAKDIAEKQTNASQYVNVFDPREQAKDPILRDAVSLITPQMKQRIQESFGDNFFVRRDMLNDALGYRSASVGDAWTGNSRWSDQTQETVKNVAMSIFGNKAYQYVVNAEKTFQNFVGDVKTMIVVKSLVVPVANVVGNAYQLVARGVPLKSIVTGMPKKTAEVQAYVESEVRRIKADAELRAAMGNNDVVAQRKLKAEIQSIEDSHRRMSIYPLIQAGEFSAISDGTATAEDIELSSGKLHSYIESLVDKLPAGVRTAGRYALITKDTALFQGMQKAVEYGDFLAKAILYDDLTKRQGKSSEYALSRVTEEYVNYDRLPGRFRGYLESMGLLWFYNFKIRSAKVALSMIRNNPVHALLAGLAPTPPLLGSVGTPLSDNLFTKLADGQLNFSLGFGQIFHAPMLNPWVSMIH